jgi:hypothetical protein
VVPVDGREHAVIDNATIPAATLLQLLRIALIMASAPAAAGRQIRM